MSYFNHSFSKAFVVNSFAASGVKTSAFTPGQFELVNGNTWASIAAAAAGTIPTGILFYLVQGSFHIEDNIGNNPGHGGYKESVKSKGINPRYVSRLWSSECVTATAATTKIEVGPTCAPCGTNLFLRLDVKGAPALRFLNHNAYAIGDSSGSSAVNVVPGNCCAIDQEYLDPAVALAKAAAMLLEDPIIKPFAIEKTGGGMTVKVGSAAAVTYTIQQVLGLASSGNYTPSTNPVTDNIVASVTFQGAYVDTKFGNCSFDTRDYYGKEPVQLIGSILNETGDSCNTCGVVTTVPGTMQQTSGETVLRDVLLTEAYMQSPYNQGNPDSARIRQIEGSDDIVTAIDRDALYKVYYIQHSIPRLNNPSSTFDNDQYVYKIYVKCSASATITAMDTLMGKIATVCTSSGNPITFETNID